MDSPPHAPQRKRIRLIVVLALVLVLGMVLFLVLTPSAPNLVWLTPAQVAQHSQPSKFALLRRKFFNLTAPLWRWYHPHHRQVVIGSTLFRASLPPATESELGTPVSTNANGMRAWILSPAQYATLDRYLSAPGTGVLSRPRLLTTDRIPATFQTSGATADMPPWRFTINPEISSRSVRLDLGITLFNTTFATRAAVADGGAVVIDCGDPRNSGRVSYWIVVYPTILDSEGNPIKP